MYIKEVTPLNKLLKFKTDQYIPVDIELRESKISLCYLRYVSDYSLLELGISPEDGILSSVKLVMVPSVSIGEIPEIPAAVKTGVPIFKTEIFNQKKFLDIPKPVKLILNNDSLFIEIDPVRKVEIVSQAERFIVGISGGYPCWIILQDIKNEDILSIKECIGDGSPRGYL